MQSGGEEYFAPPEEIDLEVTLRFAAFCAKLRRLEKTTKRALEELRDAADAVGTSMTAKELAAGAVLRCIMTYGGQKQLSYWYLLDQLAKTHRETFGFLFEQHLLHVAGDSMPWDDPVLFPKLESLVEHWDGVFPREIVTRVYLSRKERQWAAKHPLEAAEMRAEEETKWDQVEKEMAEPEGLDLYEQPCLAYLQGRCSWGEQCTGFHPEGLEGTLPPETRLGDWRCPGCGAINRHFRRRCFACPREKPQYRKGKSPKTTEEQMLSGPDAEALAALRHPWGYNPNDDDEAVDYWQKRFALEPVTAFIEARRNAYLSKIMPAVKEAVKASQAAQAATKPRRQRDGADDAKPSKTHRPESGAPAAAADVPRSTTSVKLPQLPDGLTAPDRVLHVCQRVIERGTHDGDFAGYLFLLCKALPEAVKDARWTASRAPEDSLAVFECAKRVFAAWSTWKAAADADAAGAAAKRRMHPAAPFFADLRKYMGAMPLSDSHRQELEGMAGVVLKS